MNHAHSSPSRFALITLLAGGAISTTVFAQEQRASDHDPQTEMALRIQREAEGPATIEGSQGFIDYSRAFPPTPASDPRPASVITLRDGPAEPAEELRPYQSRGQRVNLNFEFLDGLKDGAETRATFPIFDGEELELVFVYSEYRGVHEYSWFGQIAGRAASDFILTRSGDSIFMTVRDYQFKKNYEVHFVGHLGQPSAGHALRKVGDVLPPGKCGTCEGHMDPHEPSGSQQQSGPVDGVHPIERDSPTGGPFQPRSVTDPSNLVDVLIVCDAHAKQDGFGNNFSAFRATAQACIDDMNARGANSGTEIRMRLMDANWDVAADFYEDFAANGGLRDLDRLARAEGALADVETTRELYQADLVSMIRLTGWDNGGCGWNCVGGIARRATSVASISTPASTNVYSVCAMSWVQPLVGNVFAHEIGHNFGGCHDAGQGGCNGAAITGHDQGKVITCDRLFCTDYWHTTMAYGPGGGCSASTLLPYYSSPWITYVTPAGCPNRFIGDAQSDVSATLYHMKGYMSQLRISSSRIWAYGDNGNSGDGTRYSPMGPMRSAVYYVQGGVSEGRVRAFDADYYETANAGGTVVLSNPCVIVREPLPGRTSVILR